ncbi:MAG: GntR family transcriptional regulator [Bacillota bacterium]
MKANGEKALEKKVLRHEIRKILTDAILNGEIAPGERIVETRIAKELDVSQAPVREAIRELEQMGIVETQPYKGAFVKVVNKEEVFEAYKLRVLLEGYSAQVVTEKLDEVLLEKFKQLLDNMIRCAEEGNRPDFIENDIAFHELIIKSTGSNLIYRVWSMVNMAHLPYLTFAKSTMGFPSLVLQHQRIYDAFQEGDSKKAALAVQQHIEELGSKLSNHFE